MKEVRERMTKAIRSRIFFVRNMDSAEIRESNQRELRQATQGGKEKMRKKMIYTMMITGVLAINLAGCGSKTEKQEVTATETEITQESDNVQNESEGAEEATLVDGNLQVAQTSLGDQVAFIDYDSNGTAMQVMLYKDADGTVHGALNTCQVCAGSPYAYFEQEGNEVVCQNCGNHFAAEAIGDVHGGCNPVPLELSEDGDQILIETASLDEQADAFANWKKGI